MNKREYQEKKVEEMKKDFYRRHGAPFDRRFLAVLGLFLLVVFFVIFLYV